MRRPVQKLVYLIFPIGTVDIGQKLKNATPEVTFSALPLWS